MPDDHAGAIFPESDELFTENQDLADGMPIRTFVDSRLVVSELQRRKGMHLFPSDVADDSRSGSGDHLVGCDGETGDLCTRVRACG